jgi:hypothetical protein
MLTGNRKAIAWLAWSLCVLCVALAAASLILGLLNGRALSEILIDEGMAAIATLTVAFSVVGGLAASHCPENPIGWIFCAAAPFQGLSISGYEYATYALSRSPARSRWERWRPGSPSGSGPPDSA